MPVRISFGIDLAAVDFFELALGRRAAIAVDGKFVIALELFDRRLERGLVVAVLRAEEVPEIAQPGLLSGEVLDGSRWPMRNLERDGSERRRRVLMSSSASARSREFPFNLAVPLDTT